MPQPMPIAAKRAAEEAKQPVYLSRTLLCSVGLCVLTGLTPMSWPLPLSQEGVRQAARNPVPQPMPSAAKRAAEEAKLPVCLQHSVRPTMVAE